MSILNTIAPVINVIQILLILVLIFVKKGRANNFAHYMFLSVIATALLNLNGLSVFSLILNAIAGFFVIGFVYLIGTIFNNHANYYIYDFGFVSEFIQNRKEGNKLELETDSETGESDKNKYAKWEKKYKRKSNGQIPFKNVLGIYILYYLAFAVVFNLIALLP